jgi:hypothetical protein
MRTVFIFKKNALNTPPQPRSVRALFTSPSDPAAEWLQQYQRAGTDGQA